jgi:ATP-dependent Clp protease adapter protein ClpS
MFRFLSFLNDDLQFKKFTYIYFISNFFILDFLQHFEITMKLHYDGTIIDYLAYIPSS